MIWRTKWPSHTQMAHVRFFKKLMGHFENLTHVYGAILESLYQKKNARVTHVSHFSSKKTKISNKWIKTLLRYITNFKILEQKKKKKGEEEEKRKKKKFYLSKF